MALASTARIQAVTQDYFMPMAVDTVLRENVFAGRMLQKSKKFRGETMQFPIIVSDNTTGGSFSGFDTLDTASTDNMVKLSYTPRASYKTAALPLDEVTANVSSNSEKVLDLMELHVTHAAQSLANAIGTQFYSDGTGNSSKDFLGLTAIVDDGTSVTTIGGQSRTTYPSLSSTVTASGGTLAVPKMVTLWNAVSDGSQEPTVLISDRTVQSLYEQLLAPQERYVKSDNVKKEGLTGQAGYMTLAFKGVPFLADRKATSGVLFMLNEDYLDFYGAPFAMAKPVKAMKSGEIKGNDYGPSLGFSYTDWVMPINQAAIVSHIYVYGQLISNNFRRHGKLTGCTSV